MRPALRSRFLAAVTVALTMGRWPLPVCGQSVESGPARSFDHLRPIDALAREFLAEAWRGSQAVRDLVEILETSDVFVQIEVRSQEATRGILRFMSGSPECRWVRITVRQFGKRRHLLAALAHELQHAVEIAEAPEARDLESVEALFRRIRRDEPTFETDAALAVEEQVKQELARNGVVR